ncbi:MAG: hypothetical protein HN368_15820 [Spirochaetales bacterium]|jgi:hypothetical protein|nr:hypothetical protein [Spirochaetales bacterium]
MGKIPVSIIFDTDLETDCDDVGALCLLHNFQTAGLCAIKAVIGDGFSDYIAPSAEVINAWFGRSEIPVGALRIPGYVDDPTYEAYRRHISMFEQSFPSRLYNRRLPTGTPYEGKKTEDYPDAVRIYRQVLAAAENDEVVVCVVGFMTALAGLLKSLPDDISPLSGIELATRKIQHVVSMAVVSPCPGEGNGNFNFYIDLPAAHFVVDNLPVPVYLSSWGTSITTGERFMASVPAEHPGRLAYEMYLDNDLLTPPEGNRSSWDQVAALFSVLGEEKYFDVTRGFTLTSSGDEFEWVKIPGGRGDRYIKPRHEKEMEQVIEDWMIGPSQI